MTLQTHPLPPPPRPTPRQVTGYAPVIPTFSSPTIPAITGTPAVSLLPVQVVGLIPIYDCNSEECRELCTSVCGGYKNPVFGEYDSGVATPLASYENDFSPFFFNFTLVQQYLTTFVVTYTLEKYSAGAWGTVITFTSANTYGTLFAIGSMPSHPTYSGVSINWGAVVMDHGAGCYRFKINAVYTSTTWNNNYGAEPVPIPLPLCGVSPIFELEAWDCEKAHGTAKFEVWNTGIVGDPYEDYLKHDLCGIMLYDSIRVKGLLGFPTTPTYKMVNNKWGIPKQGLIEHVRDEQIQQWTYKSGLMPEYIHARFSTFAMMSDKMFGSDYNINNSDWTIRRKNIIKTPNSAYEPEWLDETADWQKRDKGFVTVKFERGVQSVEKYNCCSTRPGGL